MILPPWLLSQDGLIHCSAARPELKFRANSSSPLKWTKRRFISCSRFQPTLAMSQGIHDTVGESTEGSDPPIPRSQALAWERISRGSASRERRRQSLQRRIPSQSLGTSIGEGCYPSTNSPTVSFIPWRVGRE